MSLRILLTGGSGFLGKYLQSEAPSGCEYTSLGRSVQNHIQCDLSTEIPQLEMHDFDMVIHAAGLAHTVPKNTEQEKAFFKQNLDATKNLTEGLSSLKNLPKTLVFISTVAVYGLEQGLNIDETIPANPKTPYGKSKWQAEQYLEWWCSQHNIPLVILRLPLVLGENAPGNLGAMERAIQKGYYFRLGSGKAKRSMVNASDIAKFVPKLYQAQGIYNLTDGIHRSYAEMDTWLAQKYQKNIKKIPSWVGILLAKIGNVIPMFPLNTYRLQKLEQSLTLSDQKARNELNWPNAE